MFCKNCGNELSSNFCSNCGEPAETSSVNVKRTDGFWSRLKEDVREQQQKQIDAKTAERERIKQMDRDGIAYCPKCHSTSLTAQKKGFGIGKAIVGAAATGGIGLVAGNIGAKKIRVTCLKCGHQFWAGKK